MGTTTTVGVGGRADGSYASLDTEPGTSATDQSRSEAPGVPASELGSDEDDGARCRRSTESLERIGESDE